MKKLLALTLLFFTAACSRPAPSCNESRFPSENLLKTIEINDEPLIYGFCTIDDFERDRLMANGEPLPGHRNTYWLNWSDSNLQPPLIIQEHNRTLYGVFLMKETIPEASPLVENHALATVRLESPIGHQFPLDLRNFDLLIVNDSEKDLFFGSDFSVEFLKGDQWMALPKSSDWGFTAIGFNLPPGDTHVLPIFLEAYSSFVFDYVPGSYRIRKEIFEEGDTLDETTRHDLILEFELE